MASQHLMASAVRLGASVDALAALAAFVRLETEDLPADPVVRELLSRTAAELVGTEAGSEAAAADPTAAAAAEHGPAVDGRVELLMQNATELTASQQFDAIWLPLPFLPGDIIEPVIAAAARALRPGGWLLPGTFIGPDDRLSQLRDQEIPRSWAAPVQLWAGQLS